MTDQIAPAFYAYGRLIGHLRDAYATAARSVIAGFQAAGRPDRDLTLEQLEQRRETAFRQRVERERRIGREFVRAEAARVRRELGLPPDDRRRS